MTYLEFHLSIYIYITIFTVKTQWQVFYSSLSVFWSLPLPSCQCAEVDGIPLALPAGSVEKQQADEAFPSREGQVMKCLQIKTSMQIVDGWNFKSQTQQQTQPKVERLPSARPAHRQMKTVQVRFGGANFFGARDAWELMAFDFPKSGLKKSQRVSPGIFKIHLVDEKGRWKRMTFNAPYNDSCWNVRIPFPSKSLMLCFFNLLQVKSLRATAAATPWARVGADLGSADNEVTHLPSF